MNDSECDDAYRQLVGMMANQHMEWVVQEVEERMARDQPKSFDEMSSEDHEQLTLFSELNTMQKASLPEKVSIAQKRLIMLIDEIYHAVVRPAECRQFLFRYLHRKEIHEVIFLSPDGDGRRLKLEKDSIQGQLHAAKKLGHALQSLRSTIVQEA
jgi:hypothetical protein